MMETTGVHLMDGFQGNFSGRYNTNIKLINHEKKKHAPLILDYGNGL